MKFYQEVRSRLGGRVVGFDYIFNYLNTIDKPLIVETGCARQENNYEGDGQSSLLFDKYIHQYGGNFWTVDISSQSVLYCLQNIVSERTLVHEMDSIFFLKELNDQLLSMNKKIDFLYLDSFDAPRDNPEVVFISALHHLYELMAIMPSLKQNALIGVDDNWNENGQMKGKGQLIADYMSKINNHPVLNSYQMLWKNK
jgi:hypothetical protein